MRRFVSIGPGLVVLVAVLVVVIVAPGAIRRIDVARIAATVMMAQGRLDESSLLEQANQSTRDIADAVLPSVVHIRAVTNNGLTRQSNSWGAGWVLDESGHVVTNAHVVEGATRVRVELYDGRVRDAEIVGSDEHTDIAVLQVEADGMVPMRRATGQAVHVGDKVFAFGSPFGIKFSMSEGIVSGLGRSDDRIRGSSGYTNYIQTDAAINPGNSGGPLVDVNGRLVGMNTAIANSTNGQLTQGQSAGVGFAIPLESIEAISAQLVSNSQILRGYLGISLAFGNEFNREMARARFGVDFDGSGVLVDRIPDDQPAQQAGMKAGDVIVEVDGVPTPTGDVLRSIVSIRHPGQVVPVTIWRDGEYKTLDVQLGAAYHYLSRDANGRAVLNLDYVPGSESMSETEIRKWIKRNGKN